MICRKFSVLAFIWWVYHRNWTKFDRVIEFYFLLRNFPKIHRFWLILAQFLLTSSLFWIFSSFYERTHQREHFCQKLLKLHYSFPRYEGGVNGRRLICKKILEEVQVGGGIIRHFFQTWAAPCSNVAPGPRNTENTYQVVLNRCRRPAQAPFPFSNLYEKSKFWRPEIYTLNLRFISFSMFLGQGIRIPHQIFVSKYSFFYENFLVLKNKKNSYKRLSHGRTDEPI